MIGSDADFEDENGREFTYNKCMLVVESVALAPHACDSFLNDLVGIRRRKKPIDSLNVQEAATGVRGI